MVCAGIAGKGDSDLGCRMVGGDIFLISGLGGRADNRGGDGGATFGIDVGRGGGMRGMVTEVCRFWSAGGASRRESDETGDGRTASRRVGSREKGRGAESFGGVGARLVERVMVVSVELGENI